ncbi:type II toxin-antitoxin system ParD family antitoxin [Phyllobacterium zundukense]|uniref:Type II toxin-antitoxin system ParD family antitoxin n=1 Tax=Phyllobacterium zundukense TaxID=1867719 RepID=A0ACD4CZ14_9HYPH|nr:type II toxin-antitoxin system ParD family antitoxin [Phyllobacterium zundukense]UXN58801.1 type II toxin-antitoxin system ParD family antitoxin [Phyllobacterium zundukense]
MATMTVSLPDQMKDWIETQIRKGEYASTSDYVRDLVRRDRSRRGKEFTLDELRQLVADAKASGVGTRSMDDIFAQAEQIASARGLGRE